MDAKDYLAFATSKEVRYLYKSFIETLEDIQRQHDTSFYKLLQSLPPEYQGQVAQACFFDKEAYQYFRKVVLDHGNHCERAILEQLSKYEVDFYRGE